MGRDVWSPRQYERFKAERSQPFFDLAALVRPQAGMRVVDLGCGTGELTRSLHEQLRARETLGIDSSPSMLEASAAFAGDGLRFELGDIASPRFGSGWDLVFSNAALHWLPDHRTLLPRLSAALAGAGQLAIQVPANHDHPAATVAAEVATEPPFVGLLKGFVRVAPVLRPEEYAEILHRAGFREQHVRLQVYGHLLEDREAVVEWVKGTTLTDYQRRMPEDVYPGFLARYRARLLERLDDVRPFFFTFKRILMWGSR